MIVVDASVMLDLLLRTPVVARVEEEVLGSGEAVHAPYLLDVEVAQVLRRYWLAGELSGERGEQALADLQAFPVARHAHGMLLARAWQMRADVTAYDAVYLALAEALDATFVTRDARLARAAAALSSDARVRVIV